MEYDYKFKVALVGDCRVGKTSLIKRYIHGNYSEQYNKTIAVAYYAKKFIINNKKIILDIWEVSGDPLYTTLIKGYLKNIQGVILVYDVTNKESFKNINKWINIIEEIKTDKITYLLLANKIDKKVERVINTDIGIRYSLKKKIVYLEVSALKNITMFFLNKLTEYLLQDNCIEYQYKKIKTSKNLNTIANVIEKNKKKKNDKVRWCDCSIL
tara:strand:- start:274 stop:909 length:636 start_codon:yes stop_codon:yes gene_type:complete